jgi:vinculin
VIIHEEGEAGHQMPDLERPVVAVSKAVSNLVKVKERHYSSYKMVFFN